MENFIHLKDAVIRLLVAFLLGGLIGYEREVKGSSAGLRTHILVCLGSALIIILSFYIFQSYPLDENQNVDISRVVAGVVTGIGFLGAGTILKGHDQTLGLTTAASIWISSIIGMTVGGGYFDIALAATALTLFTLAVLKKLEFLNGQK